MKVLLAGPSIYGLDLDLSGIALWGPAAQGDIARAVLAGATAIGLIDGNFEAVAAVWHKEILHALGQGVQVLGGSSMGALRAAECAAFGMVPVGRIASAYLSGELDDDAAVALLHGPAEMGYPAFTEPLVDVIATLEHLARDRLVTPSEREALWAAANRLNFRDRTPEAMAALAGSDDLVATYVAHKVNQKAEDAKLLVATLRALPAGTPRPAVPETPSSFFARNILPGLAAVQDEQADHA